MPDRTGQQLGNYRLVRLLGRGGFAEVYLGEHRFLKSYAALKVLLATLKDEDLERFLSEAQTLVRLIHPNIVRVLEFGVERGTPVLVMDYATGGTLRQHYPRGTCLSLATTVAYTTQAASALQYAHNHNVIHRDVKPENMLLGPAQQVLLSDFGIALLTQSPELLGTQDMAGTIPYMAPEQLRGKPSFASDQYALGIVVYEWLCGKRPFEGTYWEIVNQHMSVAPQPLRETFPELPAAVEDVVLRALAKDPQQRFVSVQAFAHALERASQMSGFDLSDDTEVTIPLKVSPHAPFITPSERTPQMVFLSASHSDQAFAARLKADLGARGILFWNDDSESTLNTFQQEDQEEAVRQALRAAQILLVVLSPQMRSSRALKEHLRIASIYGRKLVFVWAAGDDIAEVLPDAWGKTAVIDLIDARQTRYENALSEIMGYLEEETSITSPMLPVFSQPRGEPRNPYKGLRAFGKDDVTDFFGREALIQELVESMKEVVTSEKARLYGTRLLTLIGPSGSGKSSIMMAGLLPQLQKGALPGSEEWVYLQPMVPGNSPVEALSLTLAPRLPNRSLRSIREDLEDESARGLHLLATQLMKSAGTKVVLTIDQFEELFSSIVSEDERQHFIDLLVTAVTELQGPVIVLLTLRADFYDRPLFNPALGRLIQKHQHAVFPMEAQDLRAVIEQPAALPDVQLTFEGDLIGDLLFEIQGQAGALPLLEFTLDQLFERRDGHWLTLKAYQEIGGVKGALAKHAETTYASLPSEEHRRLARALFLRLINPGASEQDTTRRRASVAELSLPDSEQTRIIQEVAAAFIAARLLTANVVAETTTIEVSHEALIREWTSLATWLRKAREDIALQQAVSADTEEWIRHGKPVDRVYRGSQLIEAQAWAERNVPSADEVAFLRASAAERQYQEETALSQKVRELSLERRAVNRLRGLVAVLTLFLVASIVFASVLGVYLQQNLLLRQQSESARQSAIAQLQVARSDTLVANVSQALSQGELDQALLLSVKATQTASTSEAQDSLLSALEQSPQIVTMLRSGSPFPLITLAFGSDGRTLVSSDNYGVYVWNAQTKQDHSLQPGNQTYFGAAAVSSDNRTLATSSGDGVWLWDIQTGAQLAQLDGTLSSNAPTTLAPRTTITFSSDGKLVASGRCSLYSLSGSIPLCIKTHISVWDVAANPSHLIDSFILPADVTSLAFSPDGKTLAAGGNTGIQLWNLATGLAAPFINSAGTNSVVFSPDGIHLAAGNEDDAVRLWSVNAGQLSGSPTVLLGHTGPVTSVAFSPDAQSQVLASSSEDQTVRLWNIASGKTILTLNGDPQQKVNVAFAPDGKTLASGSKDGTIILWNIAAQNTFSQPLAKIGGLSSPVFSADGTMIFTGSSNGKIFLQNVKTGQLVQTLDTTVYPARPLADNLNQNPLTIVSLALSRTGKILASGRLDGTIMLWDTQTGKMLAHFGKANPLYKIVLSSDAQILAASSGGDTITLWNAARGTMLYTLPYHTNDSSQELPIAISYDGKMLAVGGCGQVNADGSCGRGRVQLWDVTTGKVKGQPLLGHASEVQDVAFSPVGYTLVSSSQDAVILWHLTIGKPARQVLPIPTDPSTYYSNIVFSPDGQKLALASAFGTTPFSFVLWDLAQNQLFAQPILQAGTASLGSIAFSPDGEQLVSVAVLTTPPLGDAFTLWDIGLKLWQEHACAIANRNLTEGEWKQFISYESYHKVCPQLAT